MSGMLCQGRTKQGKMCRNYVKKGSSMCHLHKKTFDPECSVCWDIHEDRMVNLTCGHNICQDCLEKINMTQCPTCKADLKNLPEQLMIKLTENKKAYEDELLEESFQEFLESSQRELAIRPIRPSEEVVGLFHFLNTRGVPLRYIPAEVVVNLPSPHMEQGRIFLTLLKIIQEEIEKDYVCESEKEEAEGDEELEEQEKFFEEENERLRALDRRIQIQESFHV